MKLKPAPGPRNKILNFIYALIWFRYLGPWDRIYKVVGWRTALIDNEKGAGRVRQTPMLPWERME